MVEPVDYFSNHALKLRFPWRLYHDPIIDAARQAVYSSPGPRILNYGSGPFEELSRLPRDGLEYTACDIDPRAIEAARRLHGEGLARADVLAPDGKLPYAGASFDLIISMDVIEHVPAPLRWLGEAMRVLRPGGRLFLTTPNYGSRSLRLIERTALEAIARWQGFSRRALHPNKLEANGLQALLFAAGGDEPRIREISFGWVLAATCSRPAPGGR